MMVKHNSPGLQLSQLCAESTWRLAWDQQIEPCESESRCHPLNSPIPFYPLSVCAGAMAGQTGGGAPRVGGRQRRHKENANQNPVPNFPSSKA